MDEFWQMKKIIDKRKIDKAQRDKEFSKTRLLKIISTKLKTSFIGSLSQIEECFGYLWGRGKKDYELTEEEQDFKEDWDRLRNNILNNGNNQIRAMENELKEYDVTYNGKEYHLKVGGDNVK